MSFAGTTGPFRGFAPYEESGAAMFFGRGAEITSLAQQVTRDGVRVSALTGESGVGKTSLARAGLVPALLRQGVFGLYLGRYGALDQDLWQAASRLGADPPASGERASDYLVRLARTAPAGAVLILDDLGPLLDEGDATELAQVGPLVGLALNAAAGRLRVLLCADTGDFARLARLHAASGLAPAPGAWTALPRLSEAQVAEILEQTALASGTFLEAGLAGLIARDLCAHGPVLPLDLQILARSVVELRLTAIRRYERSGGAEVLVPQYFERAAAETGTTRARRLLVELAEQSAAATVGLTSDALAAATGLPRAEVERVGAALAARGLLRKREDAGTWSLAHPRLGAHLRDLTAMDRARARKARRALRGRMFAGETVSLAEIRAARRHLGPSLDAGERTVLARSIRKRALQGGLVGLGVAGLVFGLVVNDRSSFTLGLSPKDDPVTGRVVVRRGRPSLSFLRLVPGAAGGEAIIADTGFHAAGLAPDVVARLRAGRIVGALEADRKAPLPGWMRAVVDGLLPVSRGVALVLLGDPAGVTSLKQAFGDPGNRREVLDALLLVGRGRAGEDEILAAALADDSPEIRRRGVEVAAAIDRRLGKGSHATILRSALADGSFEVRAAVLRECATLPPAEAGSVLAVALADKDAGFRRLAEKGILTLAERAPAAAAEAVRPALRSADAQARRNGLGLLEQIAARAPAEIAGTLTGLVGDAKAPEEARVAALQYLRRTGASPDRLAPVLERAVAPESSPRLRAAALPLHARLLDAAAAEQLALSESKGAPAQRAVGAAVWGAVAAKNPEAATKALKGFLYDPSPEVRAEAARAYGHLRREGGGLIQKALLDPNAEVTRAALDGAVALAATQPHAAVDLLGRALVTVRPAVRRSVVEALGRIARERPQHAIPALARTLKTGEPKTRELAAGILCGLARKNVGAVSPYLRLAARDVDRDVRTVAAGCLPALGEADPKGAARLAGELAGAEEPSVRAASAAALGRLLPNAREAAVGPLFKLVQDENRSVRSAAAGALAEAGPELGTFAKRHDEAERALATLLAQADGEERRLAARAAGDLGSRALLEQAAGDADEGVRVEAIRAAAKLGPAGLPIVQRGVDDRSDLVRAEAIRRLAAGQGESARRALPVFRGMLRSTDPITRRAGALAIGDMVDAGDEGLRLLEEVLGQRSEAMRAAAAEALARIGERAPDRAASLLERAISDPASDVRSAAVRGLGAVWARTRPPAQLGQVLAGSETDSARRLVALEALVVATGLPDRKGEADRVLAQVAESGPPLGRLCAQVARAFGGASPAEMHAFLERLFGG
jgi:HEAT repeat protein